MKVTKEQTQANRRRIVEQAAELFRDRGFEGIGVADLMKASGLTHGGFYRHFASKDDLAAEALGLAYEQFAQESEGKTITALLERYISSGHRDNLTRGCPTSTLGGDAMRQPDAVREVFAQGVITWLDMIGDALGDEPDTSSRDRRAKAIDLAARAVGAIILARASAADPQLSDEILATGRSNALATAQVKPVGP
jgi:TetR/AcrR family transcriptional repressor of nem operon